MSDPLVWLPFDPALLDPPPAGLRYEVVDPTEHVPGSADEVEVYVPPYQMRPAVADVLPRMTNLRLVQTLSAGVDNVRARIPAGVTLCNGRGIHDASTAEGPRTPTKGCQSWTNSTTARTPTSTMTHEKAAAAHSTPTRAVIRLPMT